MNWQIGRLLQSAGTCNRGTCRYVWGTLRLENSLMIANVSRTTLDSTSFKSASPEFYLINLLMLVGFKFFHPWYPGEKGLLSWAGGRHLTQLILKYSRFDWWWTALLVELEGAAYLAGIPVVPLRVDALQQWAVTVWLHSSARFCSNQGGPGNILNGLKSGICDT